MRYLFASVLGVFALILSACGGGGQSDAPELPVVIQEEVPGGQLPDGVTPLAYRLNFVTDPREDTFSGLVEIDVALDAPHGRIWLHGQGMEIDASARLADGRVVAATAEEIDGTGGVVKLDFAEPLPAGEVMLRLDYRARYNFGLAGLYKVTQNERDYLATQMEPIDARRAFPGFDEPRFKTPFTTTVTAPAADAVITNGAEVSAERLENGWIRHTFATTEPLQTYLIALAVGPYDKVEWDDIPPSDLRADPVPLRGFSAAGKGEQLRPALADTGELLAIQERYFDYPYPYGKIDLIAVPDFAYGAMENAGAIIYREAALLINDRTTLARKQGIYITHAHELAHQWFGNLVTPVWWDDIWLNEAFATWMSYKTLNEFDDSGVYSRSVIRAALSAMGSDSLAAARQIRNPINANGDILDAFDGITYRKGGGVLSMFENYVGEEAFREGMRLHMKRYEHGVADVNDFMQSLADGSGNPEVVEAFSSFIFQPGIPLLSTRFVCQDDEGSLVVSQSRYAPLGSEIDTQANWKVPFAARVGRGDETEVVRAT